LGAEVGPPQFDDRVMKYDERRMMYRKFKDDYWCNIVIYSLLISDALVIDLIKRKW